MKRDFVENWLKLLKKYWFHKDVDHAASLFKNATLYQETPFSKPYTTFDEIKKEWKHIKNQDIKKIEFKILAIDGNTVIVEWFFKRDIHEFNGIYEIRFNDDYECIYFRSWEMENNE